MNMLNEPEHLEEIIEFAENPEPRCPCTLLLDVSGSMGGKRIDSVNRGLQSFKDTLTEDHLTASRAEIAVVTFNHRHKVVQEFVTVNNFSPPTLHADGGTTISSAIEKSLDMLSERKRQYRANGVPYFRPISILITDGQPQNDSRDALDRVADEVRRQEDGRHLAFFAFGVEGADMELLARLSSPARPPKMLHEAQIEGIFQWLSNSVSSISHSQPGERLQLPAQEQYLDF